MAHDEAGLLQLLQATLGPQLTAHPALIAPIFGDDAALIAEGDRALVVTQDCLVEGIDFRRDWGTLIDVGYKAAQANLSDLASKGATPRWGFCSVACPTGDPEADLVAIYSGLREAFASTGLILAGGDLSASPGPLMLDLVLLGEAPREPSWLRGNARPGDVIWISRPVGWAHLGLRAYEQGLADRDWPEMATACAAFVRPMAELTFSRIMRDAGYIGACMDVSDGLQRDLPRLAQASQVGAVIDLGASLAHSEAFAELAERLGEDPYDAALLGGEDFALLGACDSLVFARLAERLPLIRIGACTVEPDLWVERQGILHPWPAGGFDHFAPQSGAST